MFIDSVNRVRQFCENQLELFTFLFGTVKDFALANFRGETRPSACDSVYVHASSWFCESRKTTAKKVA